MREAKEELERRRRMEEAKARRAARMRKEEVEKRRKEEERRVDEERRRQEDHDRWWLEFERRQRDRAHEDTVRRVGHRRTRCKSQAYLGELAGRAFPVVKCRLRKLQEAGKHHRAAALPLPWRPKCVRDGLPGRPASPKQRDWPGATPTRPLAWTN